MNRAIWFVAISVMLAGCLHSGGSDLTMDDASLTSTEAADRVTADESVAAYLRDQSNPTAAVSYWPESRIDTLDDSTACREQLQDAPYIRVEIEGDTSVLDVWLGEETDTIDCVRERDGASLDTDDTVSISAPEDDSGPSSNETNDDDPDPDPEGDLSLVLSSRQGTAPAQLTFRIDSTFERTVEAMMETPTDQVSLDVAPEGRTWETETSETGNLTYRISHPNDTVSENDQVVVSIDDQSDETDDSDTNETTDPDGNETTNETDEGPEGNLYVDSFSVTPDTPSTGEDVTLGLRVSSNMSFSNVKVIVADQDNRTIKSSRISLDGDRIISYTYQYDGESSFRASIDPDNEIEEIDEQDNDKLVTIDDGGTEDVAITDLYTSPEEPLDQEMTSLVAELTSDGYSGDVDVTFTWDGESVGTETVSLSSGLSTTASLNKTAGSGTHDIEASISLDDGDTANNEETTTVDVADYQAFDRNWANSIGLTPMNLVYQNSALYTIASGTVLEIDGGSGTIQWQTDTGHNVEDTRSPIFANGMLFYGENQGNQAVGFNISSQSVEWTYTTGYSVRSGAAYANGRVFMGSDDGQMYAYDATTGSVDWQTGGGELRAAPTVQDGTVYIGAWGGTVYARDQATGDQAWSQSFSGSIEQAKPAVDSDHVYVATTDGMVHALNRTTGTSEWAFSTDSGIRSSPALAGEKVVFGGDNGTVYALWRQNGSVAWSHETEQTATIDSHPSIDGGSVYIGSPSGYIYSLDLTDGSRICQFDTGTSGITTQPRVTSDTVYVGTTGDTIVSLSRCS